MCRQMLISKIHRATVTACESHYEGSCAIDDDLLEVAEAGAVLLVLELVPAALARRVQEQSPGLIGIGEALRRYVRAVKDGGFPAAELHTY